MNKDRRNRVKKAISYLEMAFNILDMAKDEEQECMENIPENLEGSDRYEKMENAVDQLEDAISSIEDAKYALEEAVQ